jgi:hypothetical protein
MPAWVTITPLGKPLVPEVNRIIAGRSGSVQVCGGGSLAGNSPGAAGSTKPTARHFSRMYSSSLSGLSGLTGTGVLPLAITPNSHTTNWLDCRARISK